MDQQTFFCHRNRFSEEWEIKLGLTLPCVWGEKKTTNGKKKKNHPYGMYHWEITVTDFEKAKKQTNKQNHFFFPFHAVEAQ